MDKDMDIDFTNAFDCPAPNFDEFERNIPSDNGNINLFEFSNPSSESLSNKFSYKATDLLNMCEDDQLNSDKKHELGIKELTLLNGKASSIFFSNCGTDIWWPV